MEFLLNISKSKRDLDSCYHEAMTNDAMYRDVLSQDRSHAGLLQIYSDLT